LAREHRQELGIAASPSLCMEVAEQLPLHAERRHGVRRLECLHELRADGAGRTPGEARGDDRPLVNGGGPIAVGPLPASPFRACCSATTARTRSMTSGSGGAAGSGAKRFTANGRVVSARVSRIAARSSSGLIRAPASEPSAPASLAAATSSGVVEPAMGAWMIG